jgi:antitoxin MazE
MITHIQKWGNSLAFRIPKKMAEELNLSQDSQVELKNDNGKLTIVPVKQAEYRLDDLLSQITPENLHAEIQDGQPSGNEVW